MAKTTSYRTVAEIKADAESNLTKLNGFVEENDFEGVTTSTAKLNDLVKELNGALTHYSYVAMSQTENPLKTAIELRHVERVKLTPIKDKDSGKVTEYTLDKTAGKINFFDFADFCKQRKVSCGTSKTWTIEVEKFNLLLAMREAKELTKLPLAMRDIGYVKTLKSKIELGETPTSNTKVLAALQTVVDSMLYIPQADSKGVEHNAIKVSSHDLKYITSCFTKRGKADGCVETAKRQALAYDIAVVIDSILAKRDYKMLFEGGEEKGAEHTVNVSAYADSDSEEESED